MPRFLHKGPGRMERVDAPRADTPEVTEPANPGTETQPETRYRCVVPVDGDTCGREFKKAMIAARHFNASHEEHREDSDSWRDHVEEVEV